MAFFSSSNRSPFFILGLHLFKYTFQLIQTFNNKTIYNNLHPHTTIYTQCFTTFLSKSSDSIFELTQVFLIPAKIAPTRGKINYGSL